jgi:hypothetical protein
LAAYLDYVEGASSLGRVLVDSTCCEAGGMTAMRTGQLGILDEGDLPRSEVDSSWDPIELMAEIDAAISQDAFEGSRGRMVVIDWNAPPGDIRFIVIPKEPDH